jgi:chaperonin GroEL (HSP60 family)
MSHATTASLEQTLVEHSSDDAIAIYDCEINLKFRLIENAEILQDREQLLQILLDAFGYGNDEYLETTHSQTHIKQVAEMDASPQMRRQLMRLRNT